MNICSICKHEIDRIEIRDNGYTVVLMCSLNHVVNTYHTDNLEQARMQASELARVLSVRVVEK